MAVLNIEINPKYTDINVHPTKLEVKFSREDEVMRAIFHCVENALYAIPNVPQIERTSDPPKSIQTRGFTSYALDASDDYFIRKQNEILNAFTQPPEVLEHKLSESNSERIKYSILKDIEKQNRHSTFIDDETKNGWGFDRSILHVIGQVFETYILAEAGDVMVIVDQHAAHERLKYEELKAELAEKKVTSQMLLVPVTVNLTSGEYVTYCENSACLASMGFELEDFGNNTILVRATPEALDADELCNLIIEILDNMEVNKKEHISEKMERALYTIACKAAVKANHKFDNKQLEVLLNEVLDLGNINTCPHGRPIIITMTKKELEKEFKRIL